jgi:hypothetical protein
MQRVLDLPLEEAARRQILADLRIAMEAFD